MSEHKRLDVYFRKTDPIHQFVFEYLAQNANARFRSDQMIRWMYQTILHEKSQQEICADSGLAGNEDKLAEKIADAVCKKLEGLSNIKDGNSP